jgi:hypothetical protein
MPTLSDPVDPILVQTAAMKAPQRICEPLAGHFVPAADAPEVVLKNLPFLLGRLRARVFFGRVGRFGAFRGRGGGEGSGRGLRSGDNGKGSLPLWDLVERGVGAAGLGRRRVKVMGGIRKGRFGWLGDGEGLDLRVGRR